MRDDLLGGVDATSHEVGQGRLGAEFGAIPEGGQAGELRSCSA
jgi:hypothetical protein